MHRVYLKIGAFIGALSVLLGAFAAHQLKQYLAPEVLATFQTGVTYQFYHAFAILIAGILLKRYPNDWIIWAGRLFVVGIILFSGSLYLLAMLKSIKDVGLGGFGLITPVGGLLLVAGWISLMIGIPANKPVSND
jgi:uncharacterized membrane protein YgdD (TMEM256/DUF423 family)